MGVDFPDMLQESTQWEISHFIQRKEFAEKGFNCHSYASIHSLCNRDRKGLYRSYSICKSLRNSYVV